MRITIDLSEELQTRLEQEAALLGLDPSAFVSELVTRHLTWRELEALKERRPPRSLADLKPRIPAPAGTSWLEAIRGQWPGEESDEQVERILNEMS